MNSWQDENGGAEVGERERQHIHPSCAQKVSDGGILGINTGKPSCANRLWRPASIPKLVNPLQLQRPRNITRRPHQTPANGLQTQATNGNVTELVGRRMLTCISAAVGRFVDEVAT